MPRTVKFNTWSDFEAAMQAQKLRETQQMGYSSCYRGHASADWKLQTTLERVMGVDFNVWNYYENIKRIQPAIETFTDRDWDLPDEMFVNSGTAQVPVFSEPVISYLQYLRHFGYPSPLLDWTLSPFVAAYFAFRDITNSAESVAIYDLMMTSDLGMGVQPDGARIYPVYGDSRKNKRHFLQQSFYTMCMKEVSGQSVFASHEDPVIVGTEEGDSGEPITKYTIPSSERITALHSLESYNINAYSLFGSEESLLESLFLRDYKRGEIIKRIYGDNY